MITHQMSDYFRLSLMMIILEVRDTNEHGR